MKIQKELGKNAPDPVLLITQKQGRAFPRAQRVLRWDSCNFSGKRDLLAQPEPVGAAWEEFRAFLLHPAGVSQRAEVRGWAGGECSTEVAPGCVWGAQPGRAGTRGARPGGAPGCRGGCPPSGPEAECDIQPGPIPLSDPIPAVIPAGMCLGRGEGWERHWDSSRCPLWGQGCPGLGTLLLGKTRGHWERGGQQQCQGGMGGFLSGLEGI